MHRRSFLQLSTASLAAAVIPSTGSLRPERRFRMSLNAGAIGVQAPLEELIGYAIDFGFEAVSPPVEEVAGLSESALASVIERMKTHNLQWGSANLPVDFRNDAGTFNEGMQALPGFARQLQRAGVTRMNSWIMPRSSSLTYRENFDLHVSRLGPIADILGDHDIRFGLEYVGPLTMRAPARFTFIHSMKELKELLAALNRPNIGFVLDSFHWLTAHETSEDILTLKNEDVVACDLNDVPVGRPIDELMDGQRMLPLATGYIDIKSFLSALVSIGYDGPVRAEPFNKELNDLPNEAAVSATSAAMHAAFSLI